jgi:AAHS family 4-hydroxybenzoate transporter-like MFS transporter
MLRHEIIAGVAAREGLEMAASRVSLSKVIDEQRIGVFMCSVIAVSFLLMFIDGYDANGIAFAVPHIARAWHIEPSAFGPVLAIGPVGMLIGGFIFGSIGDRFGRKRAIISSMLSFGIAIIGGPFCTTVYELGVVRFISGLGLGGLFPMIVVYVQEFMPKRMRATSVAVANVGYNVGIASGGLVSAFLVPRLGWQIMFWLGGIIAVVASPLLMFRMWESPKYLAVKRPRSDQLARIVRSLKPRVDLPIDTHFYLEEEARSLTGAGVSTFSDLFKGSLLFVTPLLWICYVASSATVFFLSFWGPTLIEAFNVAPATAAIATGLSSIGGTIASLFITPIIDRHGSKVMVFMPLIAAPLIAGLGFVKLSEGMFIPAMFVIGFFAVGGHAALHSVCGIFYPSGSRSRGAGWALSISRIGSIGGPYIGGTLLAAHTSLSGIFAIAAIPSLVFAVGIYLLGSIHQRIIISERKLLSAAS